MLLYTKPDALSIRLYFIKIQNYQKMLCDNVLQILLTWHKISICLNDEQNIYV